MKPDLPRDKGRYPIPVMRLLDDGAHTLTPDSTTAERAGPFSDDTSVVSVYTTEPVYIKFGDNTVTATSSDHYIPAGAYLDLAVGDFADNNLFTHMSALAVSSAADVYISERY